MFGFLPNELLLPLESLWEIGMPSPFFRLAPAWRSHRNPRRGRDRWCLLTVSRRRAVKEPCVTEDVSHKMVELCFGSRKGRGREPAVATPCGLFFDALHDFNSHLGVDHVVLSQLALFTKL